MTSREAVCAINVTYHPDSGFPKRFEAIASQVNRVFVVDNGSGEEHLASLRDLLAGTGNVLIANGSNLGVAAALNRGAHAARDAGFSWAVTLDQDSTPRPGMVDALWETKGLHAGGGRLAIIAPTLEGQPGKVQRWLRPKDGSRLFFERVTADRVGPEGVTLAITSGALTSLEAWNSLGGFWEELFIDFVDFEFCLRARRAGFRVLVSDAARLTHRLGSRRAVSALGFRTTSLFHPPKRVYYIWRNRIAVMRRHGLAVPHWLLYELTFAPLWGFRILLLEDRRWAKTKAMLLGTLDGLTGRLGAAEGRRFEDRDER